MATPVGAAKTKTDVKIIILGDTNVGKTSLLQRYLTGSFGDAVPSIGASLAMKKLENWNIALWDTAGEEKYANLSSFYCRGAQVAILAIDLTSEHSVQQLQRVFLPLLEQQAGACMIVVVGTKLDLAKSKGRQVSASEGQALARAQHQKHLEKALETNPNTFLQKLDPNNLYFETSAKTGDGVSNLFQYMEKTLLTQLRLTSPSSGTSGSNARKSRSDSGILRKPAEHTVSLDEEVPPSEKRNECCKS